MHRALLAMTLLAACGGEESTTNAAPPSVPTPQPVRQAVAGRWRATLATPGGELPFIMRLDEAEDGTLSGIVLNGTETVKMSSVTWDDRELVLRFDVYDSEIRATGTADKLTGRWLKTTTKGKESMRFAAKKGKEARFGGPAKMPPHNVPVSIDGEWSVTFTEDDKSTYPGVAIFEANGARMDATFLTETGDYRYIEGRYKQGFLELSAFDGGHAFLFIGAVDKEGGLVGDFWSRASYHAMWKATKLDDPKQAVLTDPFSVVTLTDEAKGGHLSWSFPDVDGKTVSSEDPRFAGKVVLLDIFGTWCPNCNDYAPVLAGWDETYGPKGLQIVGLAFEVTGDAERDETYVRKYGDKYGLKFPLLLAGTSDKVEAAKALPGLSEIAAYPTTVLIGRDGKVRKIHSGFAGPATGHHHTEMVSELQTQIETLLAETP